MTKNYETLSEAGSNAGIHGERVGSWAWERVNSSHAYILKIAIALSEDVAVGTLDFDCGGFIPVQQDFIVNVPLPSSPFFTPSEPIIFWWGAAGTI